jgi:hypothetical protein
MARLNMWSSVMPGREENTSDCLMINGYDCKLCRGQQVWQAAPMQRASPLIK